MHNLKKYYGLSTMNYKFHINYQFENSYDFNPNNDKLLYAYIIPIVLSFYWEWVQGEPTTELSREKQK